MEVSKMEENPNSNQNPNPEIELEQTPPQPEEAPPQAPPADTEQPPQPEQMVEITQDSKNMAMLCHLLGLFTGFIGPLILWLIKKDEDSYIDQQGKEALNFQITVVLATIVSVPLSFVCIGFILIIAVGIMDIVCSIMACIAASKGEDYRYPITLRLVK